jgi:hypothetical protein
VPNAHPTAHSKVIADVLVIFRAAMFGLGVAAVGVGALQKTFQISTTCAGVFGLLLGAALVSYGVSLDQTRPNRQP